MLTAYELGCLTVKAAFDAEFAGSGIDAHVSAEAKRAAKAKEVIEAINTFSKQRGIDPSKALLLAGGSMYFRGLKDDLNDIDFMHPDLPDFTKQRIGAYELDGGPGGMPQDAYASDNLYGLKMQTPEAMLAFYKSLNRPKDQQKIQMLSSLVKPNAQFTPPDKQVPPKDPILARLLEAKAHSDAKRYGHKNQILKELMHQAPDDWVVDDPKPKYKGVTHLPTKFKLHADPRIIDPRVSVADLAKAAALRDEVELQPHQQRVVDRMRAGDNRLLLYHGLGSGKTLSSIAAAEALGQPYAAIAPASLRQNYAKEIEKFTTGSKPDIMSYTGIGMGKEPTNEPKTLIFDEAHRLRTPGTASAQAAKRLAQGNKNLLLLTGTPITNSPSDLASLLSMLNNKPISPEQFKEQFVGTRKVEPSFFQNWQGYTPGEEQFVKNENKLRALLKGKVDYQPAKLPEGVNLNEEVVKVPLSPAQQIVQKAVKSRIPPRLSWKLNTDFPLSREELVGLNAFLTGLRQASLSTATFRGDKDNLAAFHESGKLQRAFADLKAELDTDPRKKVLSYSNFIDAGLSPYAAALAANNIPHGVLHGGIPELQRKKTLEDYNTGKIRALLLGPAGSEGISTKGTNLIQLLDPHWHEARSSQAAGRGLRFDSHTDLPEELKNVAIRRYISTAPDPSRAATLLGTIRERTGDEILETVAKRKEALNEAFRKILREEGTRKR